MNPRRRWGKAGQRLTPEEAARRDAAFRARRNQSAASRERDNAEAKRRWAAGLVVPWRITTVLNAAGLYGPAVDLACGAQEPDVDRWEAGELYPTWEQLLLLAEVTGCTPRLFTMHDAQPLPAVATSLRFHVPPEDLPEYEPVLRYPEHVWRPVVERSGVMS